MSAPMTTRAIWDMPIVLATVTAIGLISALLEDGLWDVLSWVALAAPLAVMAWHLIHPIPWRI